MIKSEIISHEGNPGPNWLDHCRALIIPGGLSVIAVLLGAATGFLMFQKEPVVTNTTSQQITYPETSSLTVEPLQQRADVSANGITNIQPAPTNQAANDAPTTTVTPPTAPSKQSETKPKAPTVGPAAPDSANRVQPVTPAPTQLNTFNVSAPMQSTFQNLNQTLKSLGL